MYPAFQQTFPHRFLPATLAAVAALATAISCGHTELRSYSSAGAKLRPASSTTPASELPSPRASSRPTSQAPPPGSKPEQSDAVEPPAPTDDPADEDFCEPKSTQQAKGGTPEPIMIDGKNVLEIAASVFPDNPKLTAQILAEVYDDCDVIRQRLRAESAKCRVRDAEQNLAKTVEEVNLKLRDAEEQIRGAQQEAERADQKAEQTRSSWISSFRRRSRHATPVAVGIYHYEAVPIEFVTKTTLSFTSEKWLLNDTLPPDREVPRMITVHPFDVRATVRSLSRAVWNQVLRHWPAEKCK